MDSVLSGLLLILITTLIIVFAYYMTNIVGKKTKKLMDGRYTQVLERTMIGLNTNITVLKINKKIYIIAMQGKTMEVLDTIDESLWDFKVEKEDGLINISEDITNYLKKKFSRKF